MPHYVQTKSTPVQLPLSWISDMLLITPVKLNQRENIKKENLRWRETGLTNSGLSILFL